MHQTQGAALAARCTPSWLVHMLLLACSRAAVFRAYPYARLHRWPKKLGLMGCTGGTRLYCSPANPPDASEPIAVTLGVFGAVRGAGATGARVALEVHCQPSRLASRHFFSSLCHHRRRSLWRRCCHCTSYVSVARSAVCPSQLPNRPGASTP